MTDGPDSRATYRSAKAPTSPVLRVSVTLERIEEAIRRDSKHCWVADAIQAQFPQFIRVEVDTATIRMTNPDKRLRYIFLTPQIVRNAIYRFDYGEPVEAFEFVLRGAHVRGIRGVEKRRISMASWNELKLKVRKISSSEKLKLAAIAGQIGVRRSALYRDDIPMSATVDKIEKFVISRTGEPAAKRVASLAHRAQGPARIRAWNPKKRETPEIIGGREPVKAMHLTTRQFGLRQLDWKIPGTETTLKPPPLRPEA